MRYTVLWVSLAVGGVIGAWGAVGVEAGPETPPATEPAASRPAECVGDPRPVCHVRTAEALVKMIGPGRIIELAPGEYNLGTVERGKGRHVRWTEVVENRYDLVIRGCANLEIRGQGQEAARIVAGSPAGTVLTFRECPSLKLANLSVGHGKVGGECSGGTICVEESDGVRIERCLLYGPAAEGLRLTKVKNATFADSVIEKCMGGILWARD
jgi:hypothetical protein